MSVPAIPARSDPPGEAVFVLDREVTIPAELGRSGGSVEMLLSDVLGGSGLVSGLSSLRKMISDAQGLLRFGAFEETSGHRVRIHVDAPPETGLRVSVAI